MAEVYPSDEELLNIHPDDDDNEPELCMTRFATVDEAISFALEYWPNQSLEAIEGMQIIQAEELEEGANWLCIIGVCDICGKEGVSFIPACLYDDKDEIVGVECFSCGNMSVYPKEAENG